MKKKVFAIIMTLLMLISLTACKQKSIAEQSIEKIEKISEDTNEKIAITEELTILEEYEDKFYDVSLMGLKEGESFEDLSLKELQKRFETSINTGKETIIELEKLDFKYEIVSEEKEILLESYDKIVSSFEEYLKGNESEARILLNQSCDSMDKYNKIKKNIYK
jgi:hypothetical protein